MRRRTIGVVESSLRTLAPSGETAKTIHYVRCLLFADDDLRESRPPAQDDNFGAEKISLAAITVLQWMVTVSSTFRA